MQSQAVGGPHSARRSSQAQKPDSRMIQSRSRLFADFPVITGHELPENPRPVPSDGLCLYRTPNLLFEKKGAYAVRGN